MKINVNLNTNSINSMEMDSKTFKANLAVIILGKVVNGKRVKAKNIESIDFYRTRKYFNGIACPTLNSAQQSLVAMALANGLDVTVNDKDIDFRAFEQLQEETWEFINNKENMETLNQVVQILMRNSELFAIANSHRDNSLEELDAFISSTINNSGYDVSLSSAQTREGRLTYKFTEGTQVIEGCKAVTKKYEVYTQTLLDKLQMYENVKYYASVGLEPERTHQRRETIGLANSYRFADDEELENFIDNEMANPHALDYEDYIRNISDCGKGLQELFN